MHDMYLRQTRTVMIYRICHFRVPPSVSNVSEANVSNRKYTHRQCWQNLNSSCYIFANLCTQNIDENNALTKNLYQMFHFFEVNNIPWGQFYQFIMIFLSILINFCLWQWFLQFIYHYNKLIHFQGKIPVVIDTSCNCSTYMCRKYFRTFTKLYTNSMLLKWLK